MSLEPLETPWAPSGVQLLIARFDPTTPDPDMQTHLLPEEREAHAPMRGYRSTSWLAGRLLMRRALDRLGAPPFPILSDTRGAPTLRDGYCGSLSHKRGIVAALAAPQDPHTSAQWGLDLELLERPRPSIAARVLRPTEAERVQSLPEAQQWPAILAHFAMKEAIYKAIDRFVGRYVAFREAEILTLPDARLDAAQTIPVALDLQEGPFEATVHYLAGPRPLAFARVWRP